MCRQNSAAIFKVIHEWAASGGLKPCPVMERSVVVTNGSVITTAAYLKVGVDFVSDLHPLDVDTPLIGGVGTEYQLAEKAHPGREFR